ncbi:hypothetical protein EFK39_10225 [Lactococcus lactis subsp. lactis]|nr:hypothetical protein [Lactococcus lactis subsp. lactis]
MFLFLTFLFAFLCMRFNPPSIIITVSRYLRYLLSFMEKRKVHLNQELIKAILEKHGIEFTENLSNAIDEIVQYQVKQESNKLANKQRREDRLSGKL